MCDTSKCRHCRDTGGSPGLARQLFIGGADLLGRLVWHTGRGLVVLVGLVGWAAWVIASGRTWRHSVRRRLVRREVRAVGNWLAAVAAVGLVLRPLATAAVLAVVGAGLVAAALGMRHRDQLRALVAGRPELDPGEPIRVRAHVGEIRRLTGR